MSEVVTYPPLMLDPPEPPIKKAEREPNRKMQRERLAFERLLPVLLQTHYGQYVAIHNEQVVDCGDDKLDLADRVWARHGYVPIYVELVTDEPQRPIRLPHFRVLSEDVKQ